MKCADNALVIEGVFHRPLLLAHSIVQSLNLGSSGLQRLILYSRSSQNGSSWRNNVSHLAWMAFSQHSPCLPGNITLSTILSTHAFSWLHGNMQFLSFYSHPLFSNWSGTWQNRIFCGHFSLQVCTLILHGHHVYVHYTHYSQSSHSLFLSQHAHEQQGVEWLLCLSVGGFGSLFVDTETSSLTELVIGHKWKYQLTCTPKGRAESRREEEATTGRRASISTKTKSNT